jgi:ubiquitin C-terminal hydrolase
MESQQLKYGISRFNNIGGITCYINSILHILQQIPIFADYVYSGSFADIIKKKFLTEDAIKSTVSFELFRLFNASMNNDDTTITPTSFKQTIGKKNDMWNEHNHQDSQEFLNFLISTMEEEIGTSVEFIPKITNTKSCYLNIIATMEWQKFQKKEYSPLKEIFNGMTYFETRCSCCSNLSRTFEPFPTLQIAIPVDLKKDSLKDFTLDECLDHYSKEEQLDKDNLYNCSMCGLKNRGYKKTYIWKTPKILIIHIKRFIINDFGIRAQKIINNVEYPLYDLDIKNYIHDKSPNKNNSKYNLIGINLHQEFSNLGTNSGHYTSLIKSRHDNNWYLYNDGREPIKISKKEYIQNKNAYLLFYYRND